MTRSDIRAAGRLVSALAVLPVLVAGGCAGTKAPTEIPSGPHPVIVLAIEGLRADRLGAYGAAGRETPNLDALARESVVFAWAFAQAPEAAPSLASLLTGLYPGTHGVRRTGDRLPGEARTLAELLSASGHETAAFVDGEGLTADLGFAQGFATFEARGGAGLAETGARAIGWMRERAGGDFLLLVAVGAPARGGTGYGGAVAAADRFLGEFRKAFGCKEGSPMVRANACRVW